MERRRHRGRTGMISEPIQRALAAMAVTAVLALPGCASTAVAESHSESQAQIDVEVISRGRARCELSFVESATGAVDPTGRFIALPGFCPRSSRFGDFVVEVIDLQRERSVQVYDFEGDRQGYPFFTTEGHLVAISQISRALAPDNPTRIRELRYHVWSSDYSDAPRIFDLLTDGHRLGGSPGDIVVDPLQPRIAVFWRQGQEGGAIEIVSLAEGQPEQLGVLSRDTLDWVTGEPESFKVYNGLFVGPGLLMANEQIYTTAAKGGLGSGDGELGWVIFNVETLDLMSEPDQAGPIRVVDYPDSFQTYLGRADRRLANGVLVVTGENTGRRSERHPAGAHELALRRSEDFSLIGGVPAVFADRQLAGYDFSPDGERAYLLKRDGNLEIRATRTWQLEASIPVSRYIRGGASEVIASPRSGQVILVGDRRWVVLEIDTTR